MTVIRAGPGTALLLALPLLLVTAAAEAHAFAQRYDLPLPLGFYLAGAGAAVAVSFMVTGLVVLAPAAPTRKLAITVPPSVAATLEGLLAVASVGMFTVLIAAGLMGEQDDLERNLLPAFVWIGFWVGLVFIAALAGDPWPLINPWLILARWTVALLGRRVTAWPTRAVPKWLGCWPAVALFLGFAWIELVWPSNAIPARLAWVILAYSALTWLAMAIFGIEAWVRRGEIFTLIFGLFGRFAPLTARRAPGGSAQLLLRPWGSGLAAAPPPTVSETALVLVLLATVSFDGIAETPFWYDLHGAVLRLLYDLGLVAQLGYVAAGSAIRTMGLFATPLLFAAVYLATATLVARLAEERSGSVARAFVLTLVPIAIAYHLAHYLSYLLIQGQLLLALASDPFGWGWDLFGTRDRAVDIGIVGARFVWWASVVAIVLGHVVAVILAHHRALTRTGGRGVAVKSQLPMVALMIGYTILSLWILAQPIVES